MKTKHLLLSFVGVAAISWSVFLNLFDVNQVNIDNKEYQIRTESEISSDANYGAKGAAEWLHRLRVNPATGTISQKDIQNARQSFEALSLNRSNNSGEMNWEFMGPDDVGGRTRAFLVDNRDNSTLWAGGVAGGLWKSTTNGLSWIPVALDDLSNLAISSICQDAEGNLYFGTGEYFAGLDASNSTSTGFKGAGIWKSTDGITFTQLQYTIDNPSQFVYVNELVYDELNNQIYAATNSSILRTSDGGVNWENPYQYTGNATDVDVASDGTVVFSMHGGSTSKVFVAAAGGNTAESVETQFDTDFNRIEVAVAPSNPDYMYALCSYHGWIQNKYFNLYRSTDGGENWTSLVPQHTPAVNIFGENKQGHYDNALAVFPNDPTKVILGGIDLWTWSDANAYEQISFWVESAGSKYVHADQHTIYFHPDYETNQTIYFANDGGVFGSSNDAITFSALNKNYGITQYYAIECGPNGEILGGTQDNGSPFIDLMQPSDPQSSWEVTGGDGGYTAISELYSGALFTTLYYSQLNRSNESGAAATMQRNPFDNVGNRSTASNLRPGWGGNPFVTPIDMWESFDYDSSRIFFPFVIDTVINILNDGQPDTITKFAEGFSFFVPSTVVDNKSFEYAVTAEDIAAKGDSLEVGDTLIIREKFASLMAIGGNGSIYFTREALNFKDEFPNWDAVVGLTKFGQGAEFVYQNNTIGVGYVTSLKWANDGETLYAISSSGIGSKVFRFTGFRDAYNYTGLSYDQRFLHQTTVNDLSTDDISNIELISSSPANVWSITYNNGTNVTDNQIIDIDTTASSIVMNIKQLPFAECDTTFVNGVYGDSVSANPLGSFDNTVYSFIAGTESFDNILTIDTSYINSYLLNLVELDYTTCINDTIKDVHTDTILTVVDENMSVDLDSVYSTNNIYTNVFKYDTISISGADTIINLISKTVVDAVCTLDTVFDFNNDTLTQIVNYSVELPYQTVTTTAMTYNNIFKIDTLQHFVDTLVNIEYKDMSVDCQLATATGINIDTITSFVTGNTVVDYYTMTLHDGTVYENIVAIDTLPSTHIVNLTSQDTTFEMGILGNDMVWNNDRDINTTDRIVGELIKDFPNESASSMDIDPNDPNKMIITVGGYGSHSKVYFTDQATTAGNSDWEVIDGSGLPEAPVYASLISDTMSTGEYLVIIGTEYGVYSTKDVDGTNTVWTRETSMPVVPVFNLKQQRQPNGYLPGVCETGVKNSGEIYAGTHGLGVWRLDKYKRPYTNIKEIKNTELDALLVKVYPNPVRTIANVEYNVTKTSDVEIEIYSLSGKQVYRNTIAQQNKGTYVHRVNTEDYGQGVYVISVTSNNERKVSKFIVE